MMEAGMRKNFFMAMAMLIFMMFMNHPSVAKDFQCEKVVISGETGWPPYSFVKQGRLQGVGVELAVLLFNELQIPVEVVSIQKQSELEQMLRLGRVDLVVGSYDLPRYESINRIVLPPYYDDSIGVIVAKNHTFEFTSWNDLMGRLGITTSNDQLGREFSDFAEEYLSIVAEGNLRSLFRKMASLDYDYAVGSSQMLLDGMAMYGKDQFEFLPLLVAREPVYFSFSEASPCKDYAYFFRHRINQWARENVAASLIHGIEKDSRVVKPTVVENP